VALGKAGEFDAAIVVLREAIRRDAHNPQSHSELGNVLRSVNRPAEAITAYREAVRLNVPDPDAYLRLAILLSDRGEYTAALGMLEQGARADPRWLDDPRTFLRYKSACCAALAATGRGKAPPPPADRPVFRRKALDWLTEDLAAWEKILAANPGSAAELEKVLARWLVELDLAVMRPGPARGGMSADERPAWDALWADVRAAIATARTRPRRRPPPARTGPAVDSAADRQREEWPARRLAREVEAAERETPWSSLVSMTTDLRNDKNRRPDVVTATGAEGHDPTAGNTSIYIYIKY
jgi:hypothetical protein